MGHVVRRVLSTEYHKYKEHLLKLDAASKHLRFGFTIKDETLSKLCDGFENSVNSHILFCVENDNLEFIAVGHIALGDQMELAFSVLSEHRGQGLGNALMKRCIRYCRTHHILKGYMVCLSHNAAIRHLCTKNGITFQTEHGETTADIELNEPHIGTFIDEGIAINTAILDFVTKRAKLPWTLTTNKLASSLT